MLLQSTLLPRHLGPPLPSGIGRLRADFLPSVSHCHGLRLPGPPAMAATEEPKNEVNFEHRVAIEVRHAFS